MTKLFEILIPVRDNDKLEFGFSHNVNWDNAVLVIAGGLTKYPPVKGQWISNSNELFSEDMIPVRIACSEEQIEEIADFTAKHYKQLAVMYYLVSNNVIIKSYE